MLAVGLVALPETLALFAGQHDWYAVDKDNTSDMGVPCMKCHADVQSQMDNMEVGGAHSASVTCYDCHITSVVDKYGATVGGAGDIHAATAPACMDCHDGSWAAPVATSIVNGTREAHKDFINSSDANTLMEGANEACVGCHTHVAVTITWNKPTNLSFTANSSNVGVWTVGNFASSGSTTTVTNG